MKPKRHDWQLHRILVSAALSRGQLLLPSIALTLFVVTGCRTPTNQLYPLGIYSVARTNLALVRQAGFNLVVGSAEKGYLDAAASNGLQVLASPGTSAGRGFSAEHARSAVRAFDSHPGLWGWYVVDEPDLLRLPPREVRQANQFLKNLGARKPTALVLYQGYNAIDYGNIADVTMIDRYPIPWLPLANFAQHVRQVRLVLGRGKPLIAVVQAMSWEAYPELMPGESNLRAPTYEELRCMTYCALVEGATGLFYYCFGDDRWKILDHPEVWQGVQRVVAEVNERLPLFQAEHLFWPYLQEFDDPSLRFNEALEASIRAVLLRVRRGNGSLAAGNYILAVNTTSHSNRSKFSLPTSVGGAVQVVGEKRLLILERGWIEDEFGPYAVHLYGPLAAD